MALLRRLLPEVVRVCARARDEKHDFKAGPAADSRGWLQLGLNSPVLRPCLRPAHARTSGGGPRGAWRAAAATHLSAVRRRACVSPSPPSWFAMRYFSIAATEEPVRSPRAVMAREMRAAARGGGARASMRGRARRHAVPRSHAPSFARVLPSPPPSTRGRMRTTRARPGARRETIEYPARRGAAGAARHPARRRPTRTASRHAAGGL